MFQIILKGCIETVSPEDLINKINNTIKDCNSELVGQFQVYQLAPYVEYQKCENLADESGDSNI